MKWTSDLTNLRDVLADLYFTVQDARRIVEEAGLDPKYIEFDNRAIINWHNILRHAQNHHKVQTIIKVAQKDFPENTYLILAKQNHLTAVKGPDIDTQIDWQGEEDIDQLEKIIGQQSTLLPISFLEAGFMKARSVVRIVRADSASGTGFLTNHNLLITNNHVLSTKEEAEHAIIQFNYQKLASGLDATIAEFKLAPDEVFTTSKEDDWTVVKVQGNPNAQWGALLLSHAKLNKRDQVIIIQHPGGGPKQIAFYHNVVVYIGNQRVQYLTDTLPGSSGAPVFDHDWNVVALHHSGGWLREPGSKQVYYRNEGVHIDVVIEGLIDIGLYSG